MDEPAEPTTPAAAKHGIGTPRRVDLGDLPEDPDFVQMSQVVLEAAKICVEVMTALGQGCTPDLLAEGKGRLRRAFQQGERADADGEG